MSQERSLSRSRSRSRSRHNSASPERSPYFEKKENEDEVENNENDGNVVETLYVSNLNVDTTEEQLQNHFSTVGVVKSVSIMYEPITKKSRGFAFVKMENEESTEKALNDLNQSELHNRLIKIEKARRNDGHSKTPGRYLGKHVIYNNTHKSGYRGHPSNYNPNFRKSYGYPPRGSNPTHEGGYDRGYKPSYNKPYYPRHDTGPSNPPPYGYSQNYRAPPRENRNTPQYPYPPRDSRAPPRYRSPPRGERYDDFKRDSREFRARSRDAGYPQHDSSSSSRHPPRSSSPSSAPPSHSSAPHHPYPPRSSSPPSRYPQQHQTQYTRDAPYSRDAPRTHRENNNYDGPRHYPR